MWSPDEGQVIWEIFISGVGGAENAWNNHRVSTKTSSFGRGIDIAGGHLKQVYIVILPAAGRINMLAGAL